MKKAIVAFGIIDTLFFIVVWAVGLIDTGHGLVTEAVHFLYWATAWIGLIYLVYGFVVLIRGGSKRLSEAVLLVLFGLVPGLIALVALLSSLGTHPV